MLRVERESTLSFIAALVAAVVAVTCHRGSRLDVPAAAADPSGRATPAASPPRTVAQAPSSLPAALASYAPSAKSPPPLALERFYRALEALEAKTSAEHVRVVWYGDSHTAADYFTGAVRRRLEARFGAGGPGFVRVGTSPYRHDGVRVIRDGKWKILPEPPSRRTLEGDGIFWLGGLLAQPVNKEARVEIRVDPKRVRGSLRYGLVYQPKAGASFRLGIGKKVETVDARTPADKISESGLVRLRREGASGDKLEIALTTGEIRFAGLVAEGTEPGVVLDTIGIDGARAATPLAWNADAFSADVAARKPELVVFAFGTNEAFDTRNADAIVGELGELVGRARRGAPNADCLIVGPPDAAAPDLTSMPRVVELDAAERRAAETYGCGYFSLFQAMGGANGFSRWMREIPPLARVDRIHLTIGGYERLGDVLAAALIESYEARAR
ncbi:MAG TPA: GDSL-type esterase/lipase family protein [Polyangiaceae bacterium]|nr:GDSL-type esterase/lipase family protein [Polyangiaceae bacterium]